MVLLLLLTLLTIVSSQHSPIVVTEEKPDDDAISDYRITVTCSHPETSNPSGDTYVVWYTSESPVTSGSPCDAKPKTSFDKDGVPAVPCEGTGEKGHFKAIDCPVWAAQTTTRSGVIKFAEPDVIFFVHQALCEKDTWWGVAKSTILYDGNPKYPSNGAHTQGFRALRRATITIDSSDFTGKSNKFGDAKKISLTLTDAQQLKTLTVGMRLQSAPTVTKVDNVLVHPDTALVIKTTDTKRENIGISIPSSLPAGSYHIYIRSTNTDNPFTATTFIRASSDAFNIVSSLTVAAKVSATSFVGGISTVVRLALRNVNSANADSIRLKVASSASNVAVVATVYKSGAGFFPNEATITIPLTLAMGAGKVLLLLLFFDYYV